MSRVLTRKTYDTPGSKPEEQVTRLGKGTAMDMSAAEVATIRKRWTALGMPIDNLPDDDIRRAIHQRGIEFRDKAPTTAAQAAQIILDGVKNDRWRILVGADAHRIDELVRTFPEDAYEPTFLDKMTQENHFGGLIGAGAEPGESNA